MKHLLTLLLAAAAAVGLSSCNNKAEVETYRLSYPSKTEAPAQPPPLDSNAMAGGLPEGHPPLGSGGSSTAPAMPAMPAPGMPSMPAPGTAPTGGPPPAAASEYTWSCPEGWVEKPGASMRLVTFEVPSDSGKPGDCSVIQLGGLAGGFVPNINRWRGQIGLGPASDEEVNAAVEKVPTGLGAEASVILLANGDQGILAAIVDQGGRTLFIKLFSDPATLKAQGDNFRALVKSFSPAKHAE